MAHISYKVFGRSYSMVQLSQRLQRATKTKQWERFQRGMLVIVMMIWFTTVMTSVFFRISTEDTEINGSLSDASASAGPALFRSRKLVAWVQR